MNLYLVEIEGVGIYSVIAPDKKQCKRLLLECEGLDLEARGRIRVSCEKDSAEEKACFPLDPGIKWIPVAKAV